MIKGRMKTIGEALLHLEKRVTDTRNHKKVVKMRECFETMRKTNPDEKTEASHDTKRREGYQVHRRLPVQARIVLDRGSLVWSTQEALPQPAAHVHHLVRGSRRRHSPEGAMMLDDLYVHLAEQIAICQARSILSAVGWYNQRTGEVMATAIMKHASEILNRPEYSDYKEEWQDLEDRKRDNTQAFMDSFEPDEHIGWHAYSDYEENEKQEAIIKNVYGDGWVRFGLFKSRHYYNTLEVSGRFDDSARKKLEILAKDLEVKLSIEDII